MMDLREYQSKPARLADYLPWAALVAPGVVLNKDGSLQRTLRYRGPDTESATAAELVALTGKLNDMLRRFGSGWAFFFEVERRPVQAYPESVFPDRVSWLVDEERKASFADSDHFYENHSYLTLCYLPPEDRVRHTEKLFIEGSEQQRMSASDPLKVFQRKTDRLIGLLSHLMTEVKALDDEETLSYLHRTVSTKSHRVAVPEVPVYLDAILPDTPFTGGLAPKLGEEHLKIITVAGFPSSTVPGLMDGLGALGFPYRFVTRFIPLDKAAAQKELNRYRRQWFSKRKSIMAVLKEVMTGEASVLLDTDADNKAADVDMALQELGSDYASFGYYSAVIVVRDRDLKRAEEKQQAVERILGGRGLTTISETVGSVDAWLSSLPGQLYAGVRQPLVSSLNLAHMMPVSTAWAGQPENSHLAGPPLLMAAASGHTPFRLSTHVGDVGHTLIVGPTGAGKSVLLSFMALQFRRYKAAQVYMFDKGGSARLSTLAAGGHHYRLGLGDVGLGEETPCGLSFQPLAHMDDPVEKAWAADWLASLLAHEKLSVTPEIRSALWLALESLASAPKSERTLTGLSLLLQDASIKAALAPYTLGGAFGALLDADEERFTLGRSMTFEMEELMHLPKLVMPVLTYLFHRLEACFTGAPTLLILDEAWLFLDDPLFAERIREWLKTLRKKNVSVIFATQSLSDITESMIAPAVMESCASRFFLPNPRALEPQSKRAYERFGLNARQITLLAAATPKRDYYYESRIGCRLFSLDLGPVALAFCAAAGKEDQRLIDRLIPANDNTPMKDNQSGSADHIQKDSAACLLARRYLLERNLPWAADLLANPPTCLPDSETSLRQKMASSIKSDQRETGQTVTGQATTDQDAPEG